MTATKSILFAGSLLLVLGFSACPKKAKVSGEIDMGNCQTSGSNSLQCPSSGTEVIAIPAAVASEFITRKRSSDPQNKQYAAFYFEGLPQGLSTKANSEGHFTIEVPAGDYVLAAHNQIRVASRETSGGSRRPDKVEHFYWMIRVSLIAGESKTVSTLDEKNMVNSAFPDSFIKKIPISEVDTLEKLDSSVQPVVHPLPCELPDQMGAVLYPETELITGRKVKVRLFVRNAAPREDPDQVQAKAVIRYLNRATGNCENIEIKGKGNVEFEVPASNPSPILVYQYLYQESHKYESKALRACRTYSSCSGSGKLLQLRAVRAGTEVPDAENNDSMVVFWWEGEDSKLPRTWCPVDDGKGICSFLW